MILPLIPALIVTVLYVALHVWMRISWHKTREELKRSTREWERLIDEQGDDLR